MNQTLQFTLTYDDFVEFQRAYKAVKKSYPQQSKSRKNRRREFIFWGVVLIFGIMIFISLPTSSPPPGLAATPTTPNNLISDLLTFAPWIIIFIVVWIYFYYTSRSGGLKKAWSQNIDLSQPQTVTVTTESITFASTLSNTQNRWLAFKHFHESPQHFYFFLSPTRAHILPKRAFPDPASLDAFRQLATSQILRPTGGFPVLPPTPPTS